MRTDLRSAPSIAGRAGCRDGRARARQGRPSRCRLCHPGAMTSPRPVRGTGRVPVLRDEWREPLRAQRDPTRRERRTGPRQPRAAAPVAQTDLAGPVRLHLRLARLRAAGPGGAHRGGDLPDGDRDQRGEAGGERGHPGPAGHRCGGHVDPRRTTRGLAAFDANLPTGMLPDGGPFTEAGDKTWHVVPGTTPQVGQGTAKVFRYTVEVEDGLDTTMFGGDDAFAADGRPDAGQPQELDAQPAVRVHPDRQRQTRLPGLADVSDDGARGLRLRIPARDVLLQPGLRARPAGAGVRQRGALGARRACRSRATSAPTGST